MKVRVIQADNTIKLCAVCGYSLFRKSHKSRYINKEKTDGVSYDLMICDKCNHREEYNKINWNIIRLIGVENVINQKVS
jgi:hypothetical protein